MKQTFASAFILFSLFCRAQQLPPIGEWREHLPYNSVIDLARGTDVIYAATPYSLFTVSLSDYEIERWSRVTGLSETGVSAIGYDESGERLLIAYKNSNLDLVKGLSVYNIPGILQSTAPGDKSIHHIHPRGAFFYLSTGLGVIVIDADRKEVRETWFLSPGLSVPVYGLSSDATHFYAATGEGLRRMPVNTANPTPSSWEILATGEISFVCTIGDRTFAERNDSIFVFQNNQWTLFYSGQQPITGLRASSGRLVICERALSGEGRIRILEPDGTVWRELAQTGAVSFPASAVLVNGDPWVADRYAGLSRVYPSGHYESFIPNAPHAPATGEMSIVDGKLYVAAGAVNDAWNYQYNGDGIFIFNEGNWQNINRNRFPLLDSLLDFITIAAEPQTGVTWAGSFGGGLLRIRPGNQFDIFKQGYLGETVGDPGSYRVAGLAIDPGGNLWISNFGSPEPLQIRRADGSWRSFAPPFFLFERAMSQIVIDAAGVKWIVSPLGNGLLAFDHGNDIDNLADDRWRKFGAGPGNGGLPSSEVWCVAADREGYIWVGTSDGVAVIECSFDPFDPACEAIRPVVPNGNFSGYLFDGQAVRSIAVDGANRKWVATANGVFLVSANGEELLHQFTEFNSPLLSSDVRQVAINGKTGEVFFATLKGICSFRGSATEPLPESESPLKIFPNPVPPGFTGSIGIRGLAQNVIVKITEADGRLVYQSRSLGGQAIWNGRDLRGNRVSSGVYLVLVSNDQGKDNVAGRIVFIN